MKDFVFYRYLEKNIKISNVYTIYILYRSKSSKILGILSCIENISINIW